MGQLIIVNAPSTFTFIWSAMKAWLSKETLDKVDIVGNNYKDVLLDLIDAGSLPETLGGTCTCKEYGGCHLSGVGPWLDGREGWGPEAKAKREKEKIEREAKDQPKLDGDGTTSAPVKNTEPLLNAESVSSNITTVLD
jgi:hypothetical protein